MYHSIKRLYFAGKLNEQALDNAIKLTWLTEEEKQMIKDEKVKYDADPDNYGSMYSYP